MDDETEQKLREHLAVESARFFSELEKENGVFSREFESNHTIVEQDVINDCFYRLLEGRVRFEKRIIDPISGAINAGTVLGSMTSADPWTCFCELSALGIQSHTSAAIVADSNDVVVQIIPNAIFSAFAEHHRDLEVLFFKLICQKLARMLMGLHARQLTLANTQLSKKVFPGLQIHNQAVICSWPASVKSGFGSDKGHLILSHNYMTFLKKKASEKKGVVADAADADVTTIVLKDLQDASFSKERTFTLRDKKNTLTVTLKATVSPESVKDIVATARASLHYVMEKPIPKLAECDRCKDLFCSYCRSLSPDQNKCPSEAAFAGAHQYLPNLPQSSDRKFVCHRCGNEGTHILSPTDLASMIEKFGTQAVVEGEYLQKRESEVSHIGYIIQGHCRVSALVNGVEKDVSTVMEGETYGDIGAFLKAPASANVIAGEGGCVIIKFPVEFLFAVKKKPDSFFCFNRPFLGRVYFALMQLMWSRIIKQEEGQINKWKAPLEKR